MLTRRTQQPFDILCADFVGPLPRSKQGRTMLVVIFDLFSKSVGLVPIKKAKTAQLGVPGKDPHPLMGNAHIRLG